MPTFVGGGGGGSLTDPYLVRKSVTFDGTAGNGAVGTVAIFTVTGQVRILTITGYCSADLTSAGAGTLTFGTTGSGSAFVASTNQTDLDVGEFWAAATPNSNTTIPNAMKDVLVTQNIQLTVGTAAATGGTLQFHCYWLPLSSGASLAAA